MTSTASLKGLSLTKVDVISLVIVITREVSVNNDEISLTLRNNRMWCNLLLRSNLTKSNRLRFSKDERTETCGNEWVWAFRNRRNL
ncbi:MAG: hypothetical protein ACTS6G_04315 [Candidatus Hodgkinia cicadicola]